MPSVTKLARIVRVVTFPETRHLIVAAAHSETLRGIGHRAIHDRGALVRDLGDPATARDMVFGAARHPAVRELAGAGFMLLPVRYVPLGWVATWAARRALRRYLDPPIDVPDASTFGSSGPQKNVTPDGPKT